MACCLNILEPDHRHGLTVPYMSTLYDTVSVSSFNPLKTVQMFLGGNNPKNYQCPHINVEDKRVTFDYCLAHDTTFYIHCPLFSNLAKSSSQGWHRSIVGQQLDIVAGLPAACVLHVGTQGTVENVANNVNMLQTAGRLPLSPHKRVPFHLLLEISAGSGTQLGRNWEELRHLYEALDYTRVGLCIDTQHAFASGMCTFDDHESVVKLFDAAHSIANKGVSMIHLNDSLVPYQSLKDRHAPLRQGHIWANNDESLKSLINLSRDYGLDLISETSNPIADALLVQQYWHDI